MDVNLVMFKPNGQRKDFPLAKPLMVIGRGENCDLRIPLVSVSRRHTEVSVSGGQVKAKDLASSNGTYVNSRRINEAALNAGDRLNVGPIVFTVQIDGKPEQIAPVRSPAEQRAGGEELVEIEADVTAGPPPIEALAPGGEPAEELDPIAALEALASEGRKKDRKS